MLNEGTSYIQPIKQLETRLEAVPQPLAAISMQTTQAEVPVVVAPVVSKPVIKKVIAPKPAPTPRVSYTVGSIKHRICQIFGSACQYALIIAEKESNFNPNARSKTNDHGIFQLNCRWQGYRVGGNCSKFYDIETNIRLAKKIYDEQGWRPWTTRKFLPKH